MTDTLTHTKTEAQDVPSTDGLPAFYDSLNLTHRCDGCGAAAVAQAMVGGTVLLFCGHHWRSGMDKIKSSGYLFEVPDEHDYKFTDREISSRPRAYGPRDAGSV